MHKKLEYLADYIWYKIKKKLLSYPLVLNWLLPLEKWILITVERKSLYSKLTSENDKNDYDVKCLIWENIFKEWL